MKHSGSPITCPVCAPLAAARTEANQAARDVFTFGRFTGYNSPTYMNAKRRAARAQADYLAARAEHDRTAT